MASFTGETMTYHRRSALLAAMTALVCAISLACAVSPASSSTASAGGAKSVAIKAASPGQPPSNSVLGNGSYFSYPQNASRTAIRNRVVRTINSTWGKYSVGGEVRRGKIYMTTWSFNDMGVRNALVDAARRGTTVRIIASKGINQRENYRPWKSLKSAISRLKSYSTPDPNNIARECTGSCRGGGGTQHAKFFLFDDVGNSHVRNIVMQTSMNLTPFAFKGQWNQATVYRGEKFFNLFRLIHNQMSERRNRGGNAYVRRGVVGVTHIFFPGGSASRDPIMQALSQVKCRGASNGATRIRVIQYAIHETRGNRIAKRLRNLWNAGCNVRIIYGVTSRPVLKILRSRSGRGAVPMKQNVIRNKRGEIVKYNHSKWIGISGFYGSNRNNWTVNAGSSNWSDIAYRSDEQMQQFFGFDRTATYFRNFDKTWNQGTSKPPRFGRMSTSTSLRTLAPQEAAEELAIEEEALEDVPQQPTFGKGIYKYMSEFG
jgi:PLD-like domain